MTDRERWTVYPLLVLALAISLRDKLSPPATLEVTELRCRQIEVTGPDKKPRVVIAAAQKNFGVIELMGKGGQPTLLLGGGADVSESPIVELVGDDGQAKVLLTVAENQSGNIELRRRDRHQAVLIGTESAGNAGAITTLAGENIPQVLLSSIKDHGLVATVGPAGKKLIELTADSDGSGVLQTYTGNNSRQVLLDSPNGGGRVSTFTADGKPQFVATHDEHGAGRMVVFDTEGNIFLPLMSRAKMKSGGESPAEESAEPAMESASPPHQIQPIQTPEATAEPRKPEKEATP